MEEKMPYLGVNYYPEDWDESLLDWDIAQMLEMGINVVRIGEFAWKKDEPKEGQYCFDWLRRIIDRLEQAGIAVIMGTPTATPPHWLVKKYPDILTEKQDGRHSSHGGRRHCCSSNPHYIAYCSEIVERLGMEFGAHPNIIGWQIDNEIYAWELGCCCAHCLENFHRHLRNKFGTIDALNRAWNLNLFSQAYDSFEDIPVPRDTWHNPHIIMEWIIAQQENVIRFVHTQADILHKYTKAPVGTDIMPVNGIDYRKLHQKLDLVMYNHYESPQEISRSALWMDYIRCFSQHPFWNTETEACWNGSTAPAQSVHPDGYIYMNTWLPVALGGEANLYWLWRTHWAGHELMHGAVMDAFGRPTYTHGEIRQAAADVKKAKDFLNHTRVDTDLAMLYTSLNWNMQESQDFLPGLGNWKNMFQRLLKGFYNPLLYCGLHPDLIDAHAPLSQYRLIFSPMCFTLEEGDFSQRISQWVKDGGTWVVGPLSDIRTADGTRYQNSPYGILEELTGQKLAYFVPDGAHSLPCRWEQTGTDFHGGDSYELFEEPDGAEVLARVTGGHSAVKGKPCVLSCPVGKGAVILLGTFPDTDGMKRIISAAANRAGVRAGSTEGDSLMVIDRKGPDRAGTILLDLFGKGGTYRFSGTRTDLLTGAVLHGTAAVSPYQIMILE